ncbi:MAG TPA: hypothetical protein VLB27_03085, partial [candidate division Zixibacteria bacterium]|nr:hypothetical protein [candidate division Zixibacteria bacterium]
MFKKVIVIAIVALLVCAAGAYALRNILVEGAVEAGGDFALKVKTDLGSARLELGAGSLELRDYTIDNPEGFSAPHFLSIDYGRVDVNTGSILDDEVVIDSLVLEGLTLNLEQNGSQGNFKILMDNVSTLEVSADSKSEKRVRINTAAVRDLKVSAKLTALNNATYEKSYTVERITLQDVGGKSGASLAEVTGALVSEITRRALAEGSGVLPDGFGENLAGLKKNVIEKAGETFKDVGKSILGK